MTDWQARVAGACGEHCTPRQTYILQGNYHASIYNECVKNSPEFGCEYGNGLFGLDDDPACVLPPSPPPPPDPPIYSTPTDIQVTPDGAGGYTITSLSAQLPTSAFFQSLATQNQCVCDNLSTLSGIVYQLGNVMSGMLQVSGQQAMRREDVQKNHIETLQLLGIIGNQIVTVIQNTGSDISGKVALPMDPASISIRSADEVEGVTVVTNGLVPIGTCNQYENALPPCESNPFNV
jgi:hypothetical protein